MSSLAKSFLGDRLSVCLSVTLVYCRQTAGWIQMKLGTAVGIGPSHIVLATQLPPKGAQPQVPFSAHARCGQTAKLIKKPLGTEVGLGSGHIVLDGDPAPTKA